ncbi:MAG: shikimate dehydrogenase [Halodesulfurarchaeum sp.]
MDVYGLLGNPVEHSVSPALHGAAYEALGIDAAYVTFETDRDRVGTAIEGAAALGVSGLNVTIPFKESVLEHVEPTELASRIGAVNTVDFGTDPPIGYNTDQVGARRALERHDVDLPNRRAVLLGAGGAARAIGHMLIENGATVTVLNRTVERAEALGAELGASAGPLSEIEDRLAEADLLINATSVGMESSTSPVPADVLQGHLTVMDAVYTPIETRLLEDATAAGAETIDGAWMLLYQGVEAFEIWTGRSAPVEEMNDALREALRANS